MGGGEGKMDWDVEQGLLIKHQGRSSILESFESLDPEKIAFSWM